MTASSSDFRSPSATGDESSSSIPFRSDVPLKSETARPDTTRIDPPHSVERMDVETAAPVRRLQPRRATPRVSPALDHATVNHEDMANSAGPLDSLPDPARRHYEDIAWQLGERLKLLEQREVEMVHQARHLQIAESAAQAWVMEQEQQLARRSEELQLESDELRTRLAASAAAEIATEEKQQELLATQETRLRELARREQELVVAGQRLHDGQHALAAAGERLAAEQRRSAEQLRAERQQWERLREQDRRQSERVLAHLQEHRVALDQREQKIRSREAMLEHLQEQHAEFERVRLEMERQRAEVARERRLATEQRWIAGHLWAKLTSSSFIGEGELHRALRQVTRELEALYRRERESLEQMRRALAELGRKLAPASLAAPPAKATQPLVRPGEKKKTNRAALLAEAS